MTNYMDKNLQVPNYSGVNIQIFNPAVNLPQQGNVPQITNGQTFPSTNSINTNTSNGNIPTSSQNNPQQYGEQTVAPSPWSTIPQGSVFTNNNQVNNNIQYPAQTQQPATQPTFAAAPYPYYQPYPYQVPYPQYYPQPAQTPTENLPAETNKVNTQTEKKKVVVLTDDYIRSLENYLNDPNRETRLHAANDIVKRFEEDDSRYNDPALNALLNKMLQDPQGSIRGIGLSLLSTGAAQGNNYTVQLLNTMKQNPSNKDDALHAAEALLRMATKTETINVPVKQLPPPTQKAG